SPVTAAGATSTGSMPSRWPGPRRASGGSSTWRTRGGWSSATPAVAGGCGAHVASDLRGARVRLPRDQLAVARQEHAGGGELQRAVQPSCRLEARRDRFRPERVERVFGHGQHEVLARREEYAPVPVVDARI